MTSTFSTAGETAQARIETAAQRLFSSRPAHEVRLDEIAREAGASLATIYRYYGDKQQLLNVCVLTWVDQLADEMLDRLRIVESYRERLHETFRVVLAFFETHPDIAPLILGSLYSGAVHCEATATQKTLSDMLLGVLGEAREAGQLNQRVSDAILLDYFMGVLTRLIQSQAIHNDGPRMTEQHEELFDMLWRAIANPD